ncbi:Uncharacterised protein [Mycobacterium tuberculosis]|uniref:Uncharacterized protein n=1 Tax=Mycobacterium tuberculosis TaxID=1773 RepID=A0A916PDM7_MYCTX|nr:Uncharacterised protein [Mycobacterium tuberculosis]CPA77479.1 Uncharacterised protein [Mycobacterium tuberculosis]CPB40607.1 Uncharacterised protein [Mycobacterium tuberculosis]
MTALVAPLSGIFKPNGLTLNPWMPDSRVPPASVTPNTNVLSGMGPM